MNIKLLKQLVLLVSISASTVSYSDTVIEQSVTTNLDNKTSTAKYLWQISKKKFRLDISSDKGEVFYLFNGRILYVCSKADKNLVQKLRELNVKDDSFLTNIAKGSCQAVPANFMARFFLSPAGAISTLDYSDGMQLTLAMDNYKFKPMGSGKESNISCKKAKRKFKVNRKLGKEQGTHQTINETICFTSKYDWRKSFWRQISRNLIRQPQAKGLYKSLKKDTSKLSGFVLSSEGSFEKTDSSGVVRKGIRKTKTVSIESKKISAKTFRTPAGYSIVDIQSVILAKRAGDKKGLKITEAEKDPVPVFLYHILGGFL